MNEPLRLLFIALYYMGRLTCALFSQSVEIKKTMITFQVPCFAIKTYRVHRIGNNGFSSMVDTIPSDIRQRDTVTLELSGRHTILRDK